MDYKQEKLEGVTMTRKLYLVYIFLLAVSASCTKQTAKWEMVIHARGGRIENNRLLLEDSDQHAVLFTVGKPRKVRSIPLKVLVEQWDNFFATSDPNATVSIVTRDGDQREQVMILKRPKLMGNMLEFSIKPLNSVYEGQFGEAVIYIDETQAQNSQVYNNVYWKYG